LVDDQEGAVNPRPYYHHPETKRRQGNPYPEVNKT